ncbi:MAG: phosphoenolpyruvate carboxylase [Chitinophagaceae bacterium]
MRSKSNKLVKFNELVATKFQLYNSLFTSLPFHTIERTGILISLLLLSCQDGFSQNKSPEDIINEFIEKQTNYTTELEKLDLLFKFVQYIERQVVLFDAIEDAAFAHVNDLQGMGSLKQLVLQIDEHKKENELTQALQNFNVRLVLTAHPTQFYNNSILGIINDLSNAIIKNNESQIYSYLNQLGRTPFFNKKKPTPLDEANGLIWYLENVFYTASGKLMHNFKSAFSNAFNKNNPIIRMGFWPGGDRDGNPFVTITSTLKVANALRGSIIKCYYQDIRKLKKRLTFKHIDGALAELENTLFNNLFVPNYQLDFDTNYLLSNLEKIREILLSEQDGMYVDLVENLVYKVELFGLHFASLDIRQESSVHGKVLAELNELNKFLPADYESFTENKKIDCLLSLDKKIDFSLNESFTNETLESFATIKQIQQLNGELGCNRYIISMCNKPLHVAEVFALFICAGWDRSNITVDIVPLFETIDDLKNAIEIMKVLYENEQYKNHLSKRQNKQTIMLGFSDGTKDGGYFAANWSIYKAKKQLTHLSKEYGIDVLFFDGRGGPPARGGGKSHKFYASLGNQISNTEIQLTIQGQTISSNFGTVESAQFNMEQLINAGISNKLFNSNKPNFSPKQEALISAFSEISLNAYIALKENPNFISYLQHASPLNFYTETNIGSRPAKRGAKSTLALSDLRAIPFVGAWSQLKQNVTGYYGVGTALKAMEASGNWQEIKELYNNSLYLKTLFDNCEMAMMKCYFPLTAYLKNDAKYGAIWNLIEAEYRLTEEYILKLSGKKELMENYPVERLSIDMREKIVLPLVTIQQYALTKIRNNVNMQTDDTTLFTSYQKLIMRCSFGIINAGRNSA